jgi:signal transduction histidine kinase
MNEGKHGVSTMVATTSQKSSTPPSINTQDKPATLSQRPATLNQRPIGTWRKRWHRFFDLLTAPHPSVKDSNEQRRARVIALIGLIFFALQCVRAIIGTPLAITLGMTLIGYVLSRTRHVRLGGLLILTSMIVPGVVSFIVPDVAYALPVPYLSLIVPFVIGGLILSVRSNIILVFSNLFLLRAVDAIFNETPPVLFGGEEFGVASQALGLSIMVGLLTIGATYTRQRYLIEPQLEELRQIQREIEKKNAELEAINREVRDFAYIVAHDLRSPVVNVKGFMEEVHWSIDDLKALKVRENLPHDVRARWDKIMQEDLPESLAYIQAGTQRMETLISFVLDLAREGRREFHIEAVNLNDMLQAIFASERHIIREQNAVVSVATLPIIQADANAMQQILGNLINNALKYHHPQRTPQLHITHTAMADGVTLHIRDNGVGIPKVDAEKVFQLFRRASTTTDTNGLGMGLAYVQMLVRRHGGRVWFDSSEVGTIFHVYLPADAQPTSKLSEIA